MIAVKADAANSANEIFDPVSLSWSPIASGHINRQYHDASVLADGRVLITDGFDSNWVYQDGDADIYDPISNTWTRPTNASACGNTAYMSNTGYILFKSIALGDGRILNLGGTFSGPASNTADIYDPSAQTLTATANMNVGRWSSSAARLANGKILAFGGYDSTGVSSNVSEVYNAAANTWTLTGSMKEGRARPSVVALSDGRVFVAGGIDSNSFPIQSAEIFDPATNQWTWAGAMQEARVGGAIVVSASGEVFIFGGMGRAGVLDSVEVYVVTAGMWKREAGFYPLPDGRLIRFGGIDSTSGSRLDSTSIYNPASATWSAGPKMTGRRNHPYVLQMSEASFVIVSDYRDPQSALTAEIFDSVSLSFKALPAFITSRAPEAVFDLGSGKILVMGGWSGSDWISDAELFDPSVNAWRRVSWGTSRKRAQLVQLKDGRVAAIGD